jgi:multidrug resistance efflux pump
MSEYHPNRTRPVRTKPLLTRRRILECWPVLVWAGVLGIALWAYRSGVVFARMNGAVDVDHQYVAPAEDGIVLKVLVQQGDIVEPGGIVAEMDSRAVKHQMLALAMGIAADRQEKMLQLERTRLSLESERRGYAITQAEDAGRLASLEKDLDRGQKVVLLPGNKGAGSVVSFPRIPAADLATLSADRAEVEKRQGALDESIKSVEGDMNRVNALIQQIQKDTEHATAASAGDVTPEVLASLTTAERADLLELKAQLDGCLLRAPKGGIVEKVNILEGAFVTAGQSVVEVVAEAGRIVAFLPQAQLANVQKGSKVWISPSHDRNAIYASHVISIGSRVTGVLDTTSPLRNAMVYGRHITIALPDEAKSAGGGSSLLVPGQTVIVHTRPPGGLPLIDRVFRSEPEAAR